MHCNYIIFIYIMDNVHFKQKISVFNTCMAYDAALLSSGFSLQETVWGVLLLGF